MPTGIFRKWRRLQLRLPVFVYVDDSEIPFGLPKRKFTSFKQAADEASISRLYGGIHYRAAIVNGVEQGKMIGKFINSKLKMTK